MEQLAANIGPKELEEIPAWPVISAGPGRQPGQVMITVGFRLWTGQTFVQGVGWSCEGWSRQVEIDHWEKILHTSRVSLWMRTTDKGTEMVGKLMEDMALIGVLHTFVPADELTNYCVYYALSSD